MIDIRGIYKEKKDNRIENLYISVQGGKVVGIECCNEISDMIVDIVLGAQIPSKGDVYLCNQENLKFLRKNKNKVGVVMREESYYENLTIEEYMKTFAKIINKELDYNRILMDTALFDIKRQRVKNLTYSQKRRLSLAREMLKKPEILIFQEPILNMDSNSAKIVAENIEKLKETGTAIFITSVVFKDIILLGDESYRLDSEGLINIQNRIEEEDTSGEGEEKPVYTVKKIPSKVEDKLLLFNPTEIDFIEAENGVCNLNVRGATFPCNISLGELEKSLKPFGFFRSHRSYLVNLQQVNEIVTWTRNSYTLSLSDKKNSSVPLSKGRLDELKEVLRL